MQVQGVAAACQMPVHVRVVQGGERQVPDGLQAAHSAQRIRTRATTPPEMHCNESQTQRRVEGGACLVAVNEAAVGAVRALDLHWPRRCAVLSKDVARWNARVVRVCVAHGSDVRKAHALPALCTAHAHMWLTQR